MIKIAGMLLVMNDMAEISNIKEAKKIGVEKIIKSFKINEYKDVIVMGIRKDESVAFGYTSLSNIEIIGYLQIFIQEMLDEMRT